MRRLTDAISTRIQSRSGLRGCSHWGFGRGGVVKALMRLQRIAIWLLWSRHWNWFLSARGPQQMTLSSGAFRWRTNLEERCGENHESFYMGWWPINSAKHALLRLKLLSVNIWFFRSIRHLYSQTSWQKAFVFWIKFQCYLNEKIKPNSSFFTNLL